MKKSSIMIAAVLLGAALSGCGGANKATTPSESAGSAVAVASPKAADGANASTKTAIPSVTPTPTPTNRQHVIGKIAAIKADMITVTALSTDKADIWGKTGFKTIPMNSKTQFALLHISKGKSTQTQIKLSDLKVGDYVNVWGNEKDMDLAAKVDVVMPVSTPVATPKAT